jgi:hypothetical protein
MASMALREQYNLQKYNPVWRRAALSSLQLPGTCFRQIGMTYCDRFATFQRQPHPHPVALLLS